VILLTSFSVADISYTPTSNMQVTCHWNTNSQCFVWKFTKVKLTQSISPCNTMTYWNLFQNLSANQCFIPFWGKSRVLLSIPYHIIPQEHLHDWKYFRTLLEYPLLLGFVPHKVTQFFLREKLDTSDRVSIVRSNWQVLKKVYNTRRAFYKSLDL
jgi:hypothetical protein